MLNCVRKFSTTRLVAMRGIIIKQFGGPEVLQYATDLPSPAKPSGNQVLISAKAVGVNPVDTYIRGGAHPMKPTLPYIPGNDGAGIVEEVGSKVTKFKKGDRVFWSQHEGSYAETVLKDDQFVFHLSNNLSFSQGASIGIPYFTAYRALITKAHLKPGDKVFIHGASGAVGIACVQIARSLGAHVFGTAGTQEGLELILKNGAHQAFNHRNAGYLEEIKKASGGGVDIIVEMLANVNLDKDMDIIHAGSRIVIVGSRGNVEITPRKIMATEAVVAAVNLFETKSVVGSRGTVEIAPRKLMMTEALITAVMLNAAKPADWNEMGAFFEAGQELGWLKPVVGQEYRLEQASEAQKQVIEHSGGSHGKIVLTV